MKKDYAVFFIEDFKSYKKGDVFLLSDKAGAEKAQDSNFMEGNLRYISIPYTIKESFREVENLEAREDKDSVEGWKIYLKESFKGPLIEKKYNEMVSEVYTQMQSIFGTQDPNSASAYKQTWDMMVQSPTSFSASGLTARFARGGLNIGDPLDTDQKVTDYATECVNEAVQYGIWRMQRIEQFRQDRSDILAGKNV